MRYYTQGAAEEIEITRDSSDDVPIDIVTDDNILADDNILLD